MADSGNLASFMFGGVTYDADDCLQSWDFSHSVTDVVYSCNGYDRHGVGTENAVLTVTLALAATDTTRVTQLDAGNSSTQFEAHPGGDAAPGGKIEIKAIRAQINRCDITAPMNGIIAMDVEIALDDVTIGASTS